MDIVVCQCHMPRWGCVYLWTDKGGVLAAEAAALARHVQTECPALVFAGLMTIGAFNHDLSAGPNPDFQVGTVPTGADPHPAGPY